jgi:hypothetical protein
VALATTLTLLTCLSDTPSKAYKVALCACVQGKSAADAKSVLRRSWRSRRIWACWGAFARSWRRRTTCGRTKMHIFSTPIHPQHSPNLLSRACMPQRASNSSQRPPNTPKSACCASCVVSPTLHQPHFSPTRTHTKPLDISQKQGRKGRL